MSAIAIAGGTTASTPREPRAVAGAPMLRCGISRAMPPPAQWLGNFVAASGETPGVGSTGTHPWPENQTSTHAWASCSRTTA